jgi:hypothetical protein
MDLSGSWEYIQKIAESRLATNKTEHHVTEYGEGIEALGVAGEIVARRFLGLEELVHEGFDHGVDLTYGGQTIDVKATVLTPKTNFRFLQWPIWKIVKADIVLMTAVNPIQKTGVVLGYATRLEITTAPINNERKYACHEIPVINLHPAWELVVKNTGLEQGRRWC